jgi:hypothetical protein
MRLRWPPAAGLHGDDAIGKSLAIFDQRYLR